MRISLFIFLFFRFFFSFSASNQEVLNIGILRDIQTKSVIIATAEGSYEVFGDGNKIYDMFPFQALQLTVQGNSIHIKTLSENLGQFSEIKVLRKEWGSSFKVKSVVPSKGEKIFKDNLFVSVSGGAMLLINNVHIEHYIAGVVESETGSKQILEFYKVQAIICRTYALSHVRRHEAEKFNLCDQVHCQVYKSKCRYNPDIIKATTMTKGFVLVDSDIKLINASFHSNCGGQTRNAEDVWTYPASYLKSITDTFCSNQPHAYWYREIPLNKWLSYLEKKYQYPINDSTHLSYTLNYCPSERELYLQTPDSSIPLKNLRYDWKLESTHFSIEENGGSLLLFGKGYGHGVGMCQEGAMRMAELGYSYDDILHYYYTDVHLIDLSVIDFFRSE